MHKETNLLTATIYRLDTIESVTKPDSIVLEKLNYIVPLDCLYSLDLEFTDYSWQVQCIHTYDGNSLKPDFPFKLDPHDFDTSILNRQTTIYYVNTTSDIWRVQQLKVLDCELVKIHHILGVCLYHKYLDEIVYTLKTKLADHPPAIELLRKLSETPLE